MAAKQWRTLSNVPAPNATAPSTRSAARSPDEQRRRLIVEHIGLRPVKQVGDNDRYGRSKGKDEESSGVSSARYSSGWIPKSVVRSDAKNAQYEGEGPTDAKDHDVTHFVGGNSSMPSNRKVSTSSDTHEELEDSLNPEEGGDAPVMHLPGWSKVSEHRQDREETGSPPMQEKGKPTTSASNETRESMRTGDEEEISGMHREDGSDTRQGTGGKETSTMRPSNGTVYIENSAAAQEDAAEGSEANQENADAAIALEKGRDAEDGDAEDGGAEDGGAEDGDIVNEHTRSEEPVNGDDAPNLTASDLAEKSQGDVEDRDPAKGNTL